MISGILHRHFEEVESTSAWAKAHATELDPDRLNIITADRQTKGHGKFGRPWHSPEGNLYASYCFTVPLGWEPLIHAAQLLSWSAAQVLRELGLRPSFKWPNDLLIGGKKIAGILCETQAFGEEMLVIDAIGLNISMTTHQLAAIDQPATSLAVELTTPPDTTTLFNQLTAQFAGDLAIYLEQGFHPFVAPFQELLS